MTRGMSLACLVALAGCHLHDPSDLKLPAAPSPDARLDQAMGAGGAGAGGGVGGAGGQTDADAGGGADGSVADAGRDAGAGGGGGAPDMGDMGGAGGGPAVDLAQCAFEIQAEGVPTLLTGTNGLRLRSEHAPHVYWDAAQATFAMITATNDGAPRGFDIDVVAQQAVASRPFELCTGGCDGCFPYAVRQADDALAIGMLRDTFEDGTQQLSIYLDADPRAGLDCQEPASCRASAATDYPTNTGTAGPVPSGPARGSHAWPRLICEPCEGPCEAPACPVDACESRSCTNNLTGAAWRRAEDGACGAGPARALDMDGAIFSPAGPRSIVARGEATFMVAANIADIPSSTVVLRSSSAALAMQPMGSISGALQGAGVLEEAIVRWSGDDSRRLWMLISERANCDEACGGEAPEGACDLCQHCAVTANANDLRLLRTTPVQADGVAFEGDNWPGTDLYKQICVSRAAAIAFPDGLAVVYHRYATPDGGRSTLWLNVFDNAGVRHAAAPLALREGDGSDCVPDHVSLAWNQQPLPQARFAVAWNCEQTAHVNAISCAP